MIVATPQGIRFPPLLITYYPLKFFIFQGLLQSLPDRNCSEATNFIISTSGDYAGTGSKRVQSGFDSRTSPLREFFKILPSFHI